jgi:hypothetical protein
MNERIKQCWLTAAREDSGDTWDSQEQFIERFTKVIVRECIDIVSDCSVEYCTRPQIVSEIREHFGVVADEE